jgi:serine/threonine protein kinase
MAILGEGSYGKVVSSDSFFVYKEQTTADMSSFLREIAALSCLHRSAVPGIVPFHGVVNNSLKLTKFDGDISNIELGNLALKMLLYQLLTTLSHMDKIGIVHCDIKPNNILYRIVDGRYEFVLCDFGLSHFYDRKSDAMTFCRAVQSGLYRCPEVNLDCPVDPRKIDIWSLGVTISSFFNYDDQDQELFDIIERMITPDPLERPTASMLLNSHLFDMFRLKYPETYNKKSHNKSDDTTCSEFQSCIENLEFSNQLSRDLSIIMYNELQTKCNVFSEEMQHNIINIATLVFEDSIFHDVNQNLILDIMKTFNYDIYSFL